MKKLVVKLIKLFLATCLLAATLSTTAAAQTTVSVSVNLKTIFMIPETGNVQVCVTLKYPNATTVPLSPVIPGVGTITKIETQCQSPNSSGVVTFNLPGNDVIKIGGQTNVTFYTVEFYADGEFIHGANYVFNVADSHVDLSLKTPLNLLPVVTAPTGDSTYCRLDGGNCGFTGPITVPSMNNVLWVGGKYPSISACLAAIPNAGFATCSDGVGGTCTENHGLRKSGKVRRCLGGGECNVPPGWTETLTPNLVLTHDKKIIMHCPAVVNQSTFKVTATLISSTAQCAPARASKASRTTITMRQHRVACLIILGARISSRSVTV